WDLPGPTGIAVSRPAPPRGSRLAVVGLAQLREQPAGEVLRIDPHGPSPARPRDLGMEPDCARHRARPRNLICRRHERADLPHTPPPRQEPVSARPRPTR